MSVPSSPPPYRKPGFVLQHLAREAVLKEQGTIVVTGPASPADPSGRLIDDLASRPVRLAKPASAGAGWALDRTSEKGSRLPVQLAAISGQNWYRTSASFRLTAAQPTAKGPATYTGTTDPIVEIGAPGGIHWLPRVADTKTPTGTLEGQIAVELLANASQEAIAAGELYLGPVEEPRDGVDSSWIFDSEENLRISTTQSGISKLVVQGEPRRLYTLEVDRVPADALAFWKSVVGAASDGRTFVYLPPESARWSSPRIVTDSASEWIGFPGTISLTSPGHDGSASAARLTANAAGFTGIVSTAELFPNGPEDWRGKWLSADIRMSSWPTTGLVFYMRLWSGGPITGEQTTIFDFSRWLPSGTPTDNEWMRFYLDVDAFPYVSTSTPYDVDLSAVDTVEFGFQATAGGDTLDVCNVNLVDPNLSPAFVNLDSHSIEQDSSAPLQDPTYRVRLSFTEAIG